MLNLPTVYSVYPQEGDFPYIKTNPLSVDDKVAIMIESRKGNGVGAVWYPTELNPRKEGKGEFAEFCSVIGAPSNMIAIRSDIFMNPAIQPYFNSPSEFLPLNVTGQDFLVYNPLFVADAADPTLTDDNGNPLLLGDKLPAGGFFRLRGGNSFKIF